jgi:hypothetical protein
MFGHTHRHLATLGVALCAATAVAACSDSTAQGTGTLRVQLTDAPFSSDSVARVDVYVVRVDTRLESADDAAAASNVDDASASSSGWTTVATPNRSIELLALRDGITTTLGEKTLAAGSYQSFRLIIDPSQSSVTLKNGTVLTSTSTPSVSFPSAARTGIKVNLDQPIVIEADGTTTALVDFDVDHSFVMRGSTIAANGLNFTPVVRGTIR